GLPPVRTRPPVLVRGHGMPAPHDGGPVKTRGGFEGCRLRGPEVGIPVTSPTPQPSVGCPEHRSPDMTRLLPVPTLTLAVLLAACGDPGGGNDGSAAGTPGASMSS